MVTRYDVASLRGLYTGLSGGWTYLNAHDVPQIPEKVIAGVSRAFRTSALVADQDTPSGTHSAAPQPGRLEGQYYIDSARTAVADLVGATADRVVLGANLPVLYQALARAIAPLLRANSSVVLSKLDPPELYSAFTEVDAQVRWAQPDLGTGEMPAFQFSDLVDGSTRLVSLAAGHELLGTVAPVEEIIDTVNTRSRAWTLVDISATAGYRPVDIDALGADILGVDLGKIGGPQVAALVFRDTRMFKRIDALSPGRHGAAKLETPVSTGLAGGVSPLIDHFAALGGEAAGRGFRRRRLIASMQLLEPYLNGLRDDLYQFLGTLPAVHILGVTGEAAAGAKEDRLPRLSFAVNGVPAETVHQRLFDNRLVTTLAPSTPLLSEMGADEIGGAVTVALAPFNTACDVEHLTRVVASLA